MKRLTTVRDKLPNSTQFKIWRPRKKTAIKTRRVTKEDIEKVGIASEK